MHRDQYVAQYGGKAGLHKFLRDTGQFNSHLLPTAYIRHDENPRDILVHSGWDFSRKSILRLSHPNDLFGLVDVLHTQGGFRDLAALLEAANEFREDAMGPDVVKFAHSESEDYDGKVTLMIHPELAFPGKLHPLESEPIRGSIVEHPNQLGTYLMSIVGQKVGYPQHSGLLVDEATLVENERLIAGDGQRSGWSSNSNELLLSRKVVNLYRKVTSQLNYSGMSLQMEFGVNYLFSDLDPIIFHQARFFKPLESRAFVLKRNSDMDVPYIVIGQTPPTSVELKVIRTPNIRSTPTCDTPFLWIPDLICQSDSPGFNPVSKNMYAFMVESNDQFCTKSLEHNTYRFLQKAQVGILSAEQRMDLNTGDTIKLVADGKSYSLQHV